MNKKKNFSLNKGREVTTHYGIDPHEIVKKYSDPIKYASYRERWKKALNLEEIPEFPLQIDFELNYSCNFSCSMCTWSSELTSGKGKKTWFDFEHFKDVIDQGTENGLCAIRLNYINEPFIRKDIFDFIEYAKSKGILDIYLSTNGSLLTENISKKLLNSGLTRLQVSIDATTKQTFDKIRQGGDFDKVVKNTLKFLEIRKQYNKELPTLRVNFVKTEINMHELKDFIEFWKNKAECIGVQDLVSIMKPDKSDKNRGKYTCAQPFYHMTIRYDGTILPCCNFFGAKIPISRLRNNFSNIKNLNNIDLDSLPIKDVKESWNSSTMKNLQKMHFEGRYRDNKTCKECINSSSNHDETI